MPTHEFDVTMTVRRRARVIGPPDRETAEIVLRSSLESGVPFHQFQTIDLETLGPREDRLGGFEIAAPARKEAA